MMARRGALQRFFGAPLGRKTLLIEAFCCLAAARALCALRPFSALARRLGGVNAPVAAVSDTQRETGLRVGSAVARAAQIAPFRAKCLQQALAARMMCARRGVPTRATFGVAENEDEADAELRYHVWLSVGDSVITGRQGLGRYAILTTLG